MAAAPGADGGGGDAVAISVDLLPHVQQLQILLHAVDCWPNGGLSQGAYAEEAARRYEQIWLPMLARCSTQEMQKRVPPLDVAFAWLVHRLNPVAYQHDLAKLHGSMFASTLLHTSLNHDTPVYGNPRPRRRAGKPPGPFAFTDGGIRDRSGPYRTFVIGTLAAWASHRKLLGETRITVEPFFPPRPLRQLQAVYSPYRKSYKSSLSIDLPGSMKRQGAFLHSLLRPCYLEMPFLQAAEQRYRNFLQLHRERPDMTLVPMMDIDLFWHTHMGIAGVYRKDTLAAFGKVFDHNDNIVESQRVDAFLATKAAYEARFPDAGPYNPPPTQLVPLHVTHPVESLLGGLTLLFKAPKERGDFKGLIAAHASPFSAPGPHGAGAGVPSVAGDMASPGLFVPDYGPEHVGGHAVFMAWLMARVAAQVMTSFWHKLFKNEHRRKLAAIRKTVQKGLGFARFKHLPLGMGHKYWRQFGIRQYTAWQLGPGQVQQGVAVGVPIAASPTASSGSSGDTFHSNGNAVLKPGPEEDAKPAAAAAAVAAAAVKAAPDVSAPAKLCGPAAAGTAFAQDKGVPAATVTGLAYTGFCPGCGCAMSSCRCAVQGFNPLDMALLPVLVGLAAAAQRKQEEAAAQQASSSRGVLVADAGMPFMWYSPMYYPMGGGDGAYLTCMMCSPTWGADMCSAVGTDQGLTSGWSDMGACDAWQGVDGNGYVGGAAPCGATAAACGGGGGGCGGGGGGCGGGGGGCGGGGGGCGGGG